MEDLIDKSRRKPNLLNRVDIRTEEAVIKFATDYPAFGQLRASNELKKYGIVISPSGVRSVWLRNNLESFKKRLRALEKKMAVEKLILTESQIQALEQKNMMMRYQVK